MESVNWPQAQRLSAENGRKLRKLGALAPLLVAAFSPLAAIAQTPLSDLSWEAPVTCPPKEEVLQQLSELRAGVRNAAVRVSVKVDEEAPYFRLRLRTELAGHSGERQLVGKNCADVTQAAIAVLIFLFDAEGGRHDAREHAPSGRPPPERQGSSPSSPTRQLPPERPKLFLASGFGLGQGLLPGTALAFEARAGLRWPTWSGQLLGQVWPERTAQAGALPSAGAEFSLFVAGLLFCPELRGAMLSGRVCAGMQADWTRGTGFGVDNPGSVLAFSMAGVFGTGLSLPIGRGLALGWTLEGVIPTVRPRYVLDNVGAIFRRPAVGGRTALGLEMTF